MVTTDQIKDITERISNLRGYLDIDKKLSDELRVPVINPAKAAVRMAETFVDFNMTHSKISYPIPFRLL